MLVVAAASVNAVHEFLPEAKFDLVVQPHGRADVYSVTDQVVIFGFHKEMCRDQLDRVA